MNREQLIEKVMEKAGYKPEEKKMAEKTIKAFMDTVKETVAAGESVQLVGFGTFELRERVARTARNPRTGGAVEIPAKKAPGFKAGKAFKDIVNK